MIARELLSEISAVRDAVNVPLLDAQRDAKVREVSSIGQRTEREEIRASRGKAVAARSDGRALQSRCCRILINQLHSQGIKRVQFRASEMRFIMQPAPLVDEDDLAFGVHAARDNSRRLDTGNASGPAVQEHNGIWLWCSG